MFDILPQDAPPDNISEIRDKRNELLSSLQHGPPPKTLWHYTDANGLYGIVTNGKLRATHLAYLNDASEYMHAVDIALSVLEKRKANPRQTIFQQDVLDQLYKFLATTKPHNTAPIFVTCFSTAENSLNQWRAYGRGEGGYSIGFDTDTLLNFPYLNSVLIPVEYNATAQYAVVQAMFDWGLNTYDALCLANPSFDTNNRERWWRWFIIYAAAGIAPALKNPSFIEEAEWRLIHLATSHSQIDFLPRSTGLRPIIDFDFTLKDHDSPRSLLPITDLWSGPGSATEVSLLAGRTLLEKNRYKNVKLHPSKIPFRVG